jgi:flagellar hook-length control protein FliK
MEWWHVALDVRPSSASSSSTSATKSSSSKSSSTDLFAKNLAQAQSAASAHKSTPAPKQPSASKPPSSDKPKSASSDSGDTKSKSSAAGKSSSAGSTKGSAANASADAQSAQDGSATDDAAAANSANGNSNTNSASKGRAPTRATTKTSASQSVAANGAGDAIDDPSADASNQSGMSLLQLLAQSLQGDDSAAPATDSAGTAATDGSTKDGAGTTGNSNDPNAAALAMYTQALAAALGASAATQPALVSNTAAGAAGSGTTSITDATQSSNGASMQDLVSVLTQSIAADAKGKSDAAASQSNVDPAKGTAGDTSAANTPAAGPDSLAQLGVASHFSLQHTRTDTNVSELKSPVGSAAWDDELGSKLTWMTQNGLETGSLRVSPEHLGPVEVKISVQNGDASVWFGATHPDTRAALEQALPRLREMFASQGMTLSDSGVSRESPRNQTKSQSPQSISAVSAVGSADVSTVAASRMSLGLVDTYV